MEYTTLIPPPPRWLAVRHRDLPAMFRDTFSNTQWWSAEQQQAIRACFRDWDSDSNHHLIDGKGFVTSSSTRSRPRSAHPYQNHTVKFYLSQLSTRGNDTTALILYGVPLTSDNDKHGVQCFRHGPAGLHLHQTDVHFHTDASRTELTLLVGMENSWTRPHVDRGGDSTWQMLLDGNKLWVLGRPEHRHAMLARFSADNTPEWWRWSDEERRFFADHRCVMFMQAPGDLIYIPAGWVHMVKHVTDTVAFQGSMLNSWHFAAALSDLSWAALSNDERAMYTAAYEFVSAQPGTVDATPHDLAELDRAWRVLTAAAAECKADDGDEKHIDDSSKKRRII